MMIRVAARAYDSICSFISYSGTKSSCLGTKWSQAARPRPPKDLRRLPPTCQLLVGWSMAMDADGSPQQEQSRSIGAKNVYIFYLFLPSQIHSSFDNLQHLPLILLPHDFPSSFSSNNIASSFSHAFPFFQ